MTIRQAQNTESDMLVVFNLSNDEQVRASSFNPTSIPLDEHKKWFASAVSNDNILFFLFFSHSDFVGQIRFAREDDMSDIAEISISISAVFRGKGVGNEMLDLSVAELRKRWGMVRAILAGVKPENIASKKFFLKYGFHENSISSHAGVTCNNYTLEL